MIRRKLLLGLVLAALHGMAPTWSANAWPTKPVRIIVPFSPGGAADIMTRLVAERLGPKLGQTVIVENRPGGGGLVSAEYVARADPDGYTVLMAASSLGIAPSVYSKINYDPIKDFAPITQIASVVHVLVVHPEVPVNTVAELVDFLKANPGEVSYGSGGTGISSHMEAELFSSLTGVRMNHVPYRGSAPALIDLVAGRLQLMFDAWASSGSFVRDGRLRALAVTTAQPSRSVPDLPTVADSGLPGYSAMPWLGLLAPAGTPAQAVDTIHRAVADTLQEPAVRQRFLDLGLDIIGSSPADFAAFIQQDIATWAKVAREANIKIE